MKTSQDTNTRSGQPTYEEWVAGKPFMFYGVPCYPMGIMCPKDEELGPEEIMIEQREVWRLAYSDLYALAKKKLDIFLDYLDSKGKT